MREPLGISRRRMAKEIHVIRSVLTRQGRSKIGRRLDIYTAMLVDMAPLRTGGFRPGAMPNPG